MNFLKQALLTTLSAAVLASPAIAEFKIEESAGKHIDVIDSDGKKVARVMTAHDASTKESRLKTYKVYTHIFDADGKELITKGAGGKFTHHRGIFIGWSKTKFGDKKIDTWHMKGCVQVYQKILAQDTEDDHAKLKTLIHWQTDDGEVFLKEERTQIFRSVRGDHGEYLEVDFSSDLSAPIADVELNGDPEHAGCQFRPNNQVSENKSAKYLFHEEGIDPEKNKDLPWVAESFKLGDKSYFVQHISHPALPKGNTYSAYRDYGRFGAYFVSTVKKGEKLMVNYRYTIGAGDLPARDAFQKCYKAYIKERG